MQFGKLQLVLWICCILYSCAKEERVPEVYKPSDAYGSYVHSLEYANLLSTYIGKKWLSSSEEVIQHPTEIPLPYSEAFFLDPTDIHALGFRFSVKRGQVVQVEIENDSEDSTFLFVDLFRVDNDSLKRYSQVATADSVQTQLQFEPRKDADYIVRIIPELFRGGNFTIKVKNAPTLLFPVAGKNKRAIQSTFGVDREGGRRKHHGVDIFARRHTPILAPVKAQVRRVDVQKLGGNVVWLRDADRRTNLYFAHLQTQLVEEGQWVEPGDTIGTVGNSGNARTTPTHLHFGIYSRGPIDPYNFIVATDSTPEKISSQTELLGKWARVKDKVTLRSSYGSKFIAIKDFEPGELLKVYGVAGNYLRVERPDRSMGYVLARTIEPLNDPLFTHVLDSNLTLYTNPYANQMSKRDMEEGQQVDILARHEEYLFVQSEDGVNGWITLSNGED